MGISNALKVRIDAKIQDTYTLSFSVDSIVITPDVLHKPILRAINEYADKPIMRDNK